MVSEAAAPLPQRARKQLGPGRAHEHERWPWDRHRKEQCAGVKCLTEALQRLQPVCSALSVASAAADANGGTGHDEDLDHHRPGTGSWLPQHPQLRRRQLHCEWPSRLLPPRRSTWFPTASNRAPGWSTGYGIAPAAERAGFTTPASTEPSGQKCYYVLDVLLCD